RPVLAVVYLVFNEGYLASEGDQLVRGELCEEAIRLARLLVELMPDEAEAHGLLALVLLTESRRAARTDEDGRRGRLADQDPSPRARSLARATTPPPPPWPTCCSASGGTPRQWPPTTTH